MSVRATCSTCGYTVTTKTPGLADYAMRRHSCEKHLTKAADRNRRVRARQQRPVLECTHKHARHEHGDRATYVLDRCRCEPCTAAASKYERARQLRELRGQTAYVATASAVAHIKRLQAAGLGWKRVAHLAGLPESSVYPLLYGRPDRNGGLPRTKARAATVKAILAVPIPDIEQLADGATVDDVEFLLGQEPTLTAQQLADRFGVRRSAVQHALGRAGRNDLLARLARNTEVAA